jgi:hypothetical protein
MATRKKATTSAPATSAPTTSAPTTSAPTTSAPAGAVAALVADVYADPAADAPRARLAQALTAAGDPRGAFITLQLAKARGAALTKAQEKEERALLKSHGDAWLGPFAPFVRRPDCVFERGFPSFLWCKTVTTQKQIDAFDALLAEDAWATVTRTESLLKLSGKMRSLKDTGVSIEALRDAVAARLHEVVPLRRLRVTNLGLATRTDLDVVRAFPRLQALWTSWHGEVGFADLLDASWPALEALGTGDFVRDFPLWLARRGTSRLRTVSFGHPEFQLRLTGAHAHVSSARPLIDGALPALLATVFASGVDQVTADARSAPLVAPAAQPFGLEVVVRDEPA